jgi:hypothetical protein
MNAEEFDRPFIYIPKYERNAFPTLVETSQILTRYMEAADYECTTPGGTVASEVLAELREIILDMLMRSECP